MSQRERNEIVDETIAYWQHTGVSVEVVAKALHCPHSWEEVRYRMDHWMREQDAPAELAA